MRNTNRKIATMFIGLAGMVGVVALGATVGWTSATPASVTHLADMHWGLDPVLPDPGPGQIQAIESSAPLLSGENDDMHW